MRKLKTLHFPYCIVRVFKIRNWDFRSRNYVDGTTVMSTGRILIVEDDESLRKVMHVQLEREGYEITSASTAEEANVHSGEASSEPRHNGPSSSGCLRNRVTQEGYAWTIPETAVVVMTAFGTVQTAVEAMKAGAYDYLTKPIHPYELKTLVRRSLEHHRLLEEVQVLRSCLDEKYGFEAIVGSSARVAASSGRRRARGSHRRHDSDLRRNRYREGTGRQGHSSAQLPARPAIHDHQLRSDPAGVTGIGVVRTREGFFHRRADSQEGQG